MLTRGPNWSAPCSSLVSHPVFLAPSWPVARLQCVLSCALVSAVLCRYERLDGVLPLVSTLILGAPSICLPPAGCRVRKRTRHLHTRGSGDARPPARGDVSPHPRAHAQLARPGSGAGHAMSPLLLLPVQMPPAREARAESVPWSLFCAVAHPAPLPTCLSPAHRRHTYTYTRTHLHTYTRARARTHTRAHKRTHARLRACHACATHARNGATLRVCCDKDPHKPVPANYTCDCDGQPYSGPTGAYGVQQCSTGNV